MERRMYAPTDAARGVAKRPPGRRNPPRASRPRYGTDDQGEEALADDTNDTGMGEATEAETGRAESDVEFDESDEDDEMLTDEEEEDPTGEIVEIESDDDETWLQPEAFALAGSK